MSAVQRVATAVTIAVGTLLMTAVGPTASSAASRSYYEYWGYWHKPSGTGAWQYSHIGGGSYYLPSGKSVEGWRYALGNASPADPQPRPTNVTYDDYCGTKNASSTYRVLLVVDYGTGSSAPAGPVYSCYGFDDSTTGSQVLSQQHTVRDSGGLVCGIDDYPKSGCGNTVSSPTPTRSPTPRATTPRPSQAPDEAGGTTTQQLPRNAPGVATPPAPDATTSLAPSTSPPDTASTKRVGSSAASAPGAAQPGGAGETAATDQPSAVPFAGAPAGKSSSAGTVALGAGVAAIVLLGGGAWWRARRGRG